MIRKHFLLLLVFTLLIMTLAGCRMSASTAPQSVASPTAEEGGFPLPGITDDVMGQLESFATQTAIALSGGAPPEVPTSEAPQETPVAGSETQATEAPEAAPEATATPSAAIVIPTKTPGKPSSWTLQRGEHPYCIARRFNVNPVDLLDASGLSAGGSYSVGTVLKIPQNARNFPGKRSLKSHPDTYVVGSRDTIYSIACDYGDVDPYDIAAANGLTAPYKLENGQTLHIP
jgi:LysM repeat protein